MPALSLVVCVHRQRDLLERLLREIPDGYDDLVVVHDGPDTENIKRLVELSGGRFFERPREFQQEPHWPFAWAQAKHNWILRLDADEFPSSELRAWLAAFRTQPEPDSGVSGFTCVWPLWNGKKTVSAKWPDGRIFLFHKHRVRFFGMVEEVPAPESSYLPLHLILHHQPKRSSLGVRNVLFRRQAYAWRTVIARSLLGKPTDLACWRWTSDAWPVQWAQIRSRPLLTAGRRLLKMPLRSLREQWRTEGRIFPFAALNGGLHHSLICLEYWRQRRRNRKS